ncbi:MAG: Ig-like domain-containing protein [Proteobacteria bacterium]|nr:Ig-like domain-containing protein [Pseudomonadota bacterium]
MSARTPALIAVAAWAALAMQGTAHGQDVGCGAMPASQQRVEWIPASGAQGVTLDAHIIMRFRHSIEVSKLNANPFTLLELDATTCTPKDAVRRIAGALRQLDSHTLAFTPDRSFRNSTWYWADVVTAQGSPSTLARAQTCFKTGETLGVDPPMFPPGARPLEVSTDPAASCGGPDGSRLVSLIFPPAVTSGSEGSLEYLVFLTNAEDLQAPVLRRRERHLAGGSVNTGFVLGPDELGSPVCVAIVAVDGMGNLSGNELRTCFDPLSGSFFAPLCSLSGPPGAGGRPPAGLLWVLPVVWLGLRSRRWGRRMGPNR